MKSTVKIILVVVFMPFAGFMGYSQAVAQEADSLRLKERQEQMSSDANQQNANQQTAKGNAYGQANGTNAAKTVKQVKGGRPDMSKAKGARPPMIVRPSGSGIPKGVGKPGGAVRKGGR
jgi:hypothetical protein